MPDESKPDESKPDKPKIVFSPALQELLNGR